MLKTIKPPLKRPKMVFSPAAGENFDHSFLVFLRTPPLFVPDFQKGGGGFLTSIPLISSRYDCCLRNVRFRSVSTPKHMILKYIDVFFHRKNTYFHAIFAMLLYTVFVYPKLSLGKRKP